MANEEIYIAQLGIWLARALAESSSFTHDLDTDALGFELPDAIVNHSGVQAAGTALADASTVLNEAADLLETALATGDTGELLNGLLKLTEALLLSIDATHEIAAQVNSAAGTLSGAERTAVNNFATKLARKALDYLLISLLEREQPKTAFLLNILGIIDWRVEEASGAINEPRFVRKDVRLDRVKDLFNDPALHFANAHNWGSANFDPLPLMISALAFQGDLVTAESDDDFVFITGPFRWRRDNNVNPPGLLLEVDGDIAHSFSDRTEVSDDWGIQFESSLNIEGGIVFSLKPPFNFSAEPVGGSAGGAIKFNVDRNEAARGVTIIGGNDLLTLQADNLGIGAELSIGANTSGRVDLDPGVVSELKGLKLKLGAEDSDSFLASLLGQADLEGVFDLRLAWRLNEGLTVTGAGGLEIAIPMHQNLGIATFDSLFIILKIREDGSFALETSAALTGSIGPLTATVERMGAELSLSFADDANAELGLVDLNLGFKPPNGVGLALDVGVVKGGGYLFLDYEQGEYAGAMELVFANFLSLKAIGLINTQFPDGSEGFSLLIVVTAEFGTPIQLGFGFTLIGVGGLLGLNRTMMLEELAEGVRTGSVESVMFPKNVIANAPQIISDMRRFFPPEQGVFLIGPMAKLGWGTPTLVSASLGIIIEAPPGNIAILGVLKCVLPDEDAALLVLQVKFIGALEVDKQRLWFFASLFGSRVLFITLGGEMGLLIAWGNNAEFVLSVGGFHPKFNPPPLPFPNPMRISLSILDTDFARIRVQGYFAVTSNTAQFGASVDLFFGVSDFSIDGHLGFDALFQFSPFYFIISISASVSVKVFGAGLFSVRIRGELEGTSPWHIEGEGAVTILFIEVDIPFSHTWGDKADTVLPKINVMPLLVEQFNEDANWVALPPSGSQLSVSLREIDANEDLVLHPVGVLRVSQRRAPLDLEIQKVGNQRAGDIKKAALKVNGSQLVQKTKVEEAFAVAQFRDIDNAISAPGYEKQTAGGEFSVPGTDTRTSHAVKRIVLHELIVIDNNFKEHVFLFFNVGLLWFTQLFSSNATARSALSKANRDAKIPVKEKIVVNEPGYVIANSDDNTAWSGAAKFSSFAKAQDALAEQLKNDPQAVDRLHIIPSAELREVA